MSYGLIYQFDPAHVFNQTVMERATVHTRYLILRLKWTLNHVSCNVWGLAFLPLTRYVAMTTHISPTNVPWWCKYICGGWYAVGKQVMRLMTRLTCQSLFFSCTNRNAGNCQLRWRVASPGFAGFKASFSVTVCQAKLQLRVHNVVYSFI